MTPEAWQKLKGVLNDAMDRPSLERSVFLSAACGGDAEMLRQVESLIAACDESWSFIDRPVLSDALEREFVANVEPGRRIGPYEVVREIGHGGMGTVYLAERADEEFRQQVAIKLIRLVGDDTIVQRFRTERQVMANLQHPNIARLLDGGTTAEGLPYIVMEYVDGQPMLLYCDERRLDVTARLELFRRVCDAVHYAHQNLVVHRDLKPGNVLVTAEGVPKLLDFGIAKLLNPDPSRRDLTVSALRPMTPVYASPEQARGDPVTTATDTYSLGVVLYELLTGQLPYRLETGQPQELSQAITEVEPEKPSVAAERLSPGAEPGSPAEAHPEKLRKRLRGDLDNIVLKALRKEPSRRYASVEQLSEDIRRHQEGKPVLARPDTLPYRAGKFIRRHKAGVAAALLLLLTLVGGILATAREARIAEENRARAERRFNDVRALANSFLFDFHDAIQNLPGSMKARELVVQRALEYLDSLSKESRQDPALQRELASAYLRLGEIQGGGAGANLGNTTAALESYRKALGIRQALASRAPADPEDVQGLAELEVMLGSFLASIGELGQAEESLRSGAGRIGALVASESGTPDRRGRLAVAYHRMGWVQARRANEPAAIDSMQKAIEYSEAFCDAHPEDASARASQAYIRNDLAERFARAGQPGLAVENSQKARLIQEALIRQDPHNARLQRDLFLTLYSAGDHLRLMGRRREAIESHSRALALAETMVAADPKNHWNQFAIAMASASLGIVLMESGDTRGGVARLRQAVRAGEPVVAEDPGNAYVRNKLAIMYGRLGSALQRDGATGSAGSEACRYLARAVEVFNGLEKAGRAAEEHRADRDSAVAALARCAGRG